MLHKRLSGMNGAQVGTVFRNVQAAWCTVLVGALSTPWRASPLFRSL